MPAKKTKSEASKPKSPTPTKVRRTKTPRAKTSKGTSTIENPSPIDSRTSTLEPGGVSDLNDRITQRAYELHQQRGYHHGYDFEDWLQAEREILSIDQP